MLYPCGHSTEDESPPVDCPICHKPKKERGRHKYAAKPVSDPEHGYFHSKGEYKRYNDLLLLQRGDEISNLERQKQYWLATVQQSVKWDFYYMEVIDGLKREIVEDFKGVITTEYRRKRKAFEREHPWIVFRESTKKAQATRRRHY